MTAAAVKVWAFVAAVIVTVAALAIWRAEVRRDAVKDAKLVALEHATDSLSKLAARVDTAIIHDTLLMKKAITHYDTVKVATEFAWLHDTIPVPVEVVKEIVAAADSSILYCKVTVSDCIKEVNMQKSLVAKKDSVISILKGQKPSILSRCGLSAGYGLVMAGGRLETGPSAIAGCRIWP